MVKKRICMVVCLLMITGPGFCGELETIAASVEKLGIQRRGYTLCGVLTSEQRAHARENMEKAKSEKVYRFRDKTLNIVADQSTHRVLVIFEQFNPIDQTGVQHLLGDLFTAYGEPTVSVQDRMVYWAWDETEKITADRYKAARAKEQIPAVMATVKLNSEIPIMASSETQPRGKAYYIISADPLLRFYKDE